MSSHQRIFNNKFQVPGHQALGHTIDSERGRGRGGGGGRDRWNREKGDVEGKILK